MKMLLPLTPEQLARTEEFLLNPPPGSKAESAKQYGVDLTLLIEQLRLTPAQHANNMALASMQASKVRGVARRRS